MGDIENQSLDYKIAAAQQSEQRSKNIILALRKIMQQMIIPEN